MFSSNGLNGQQTYRRSWLWRVLLSSTLVFSVLQATTPVHAVASDYTNGQIALDALLVSGQPTTLASAGFMGISGFDPSTTLRLSLTISKGGTFSLGQTSNCLETNVPVSVIDLAASSSHEVALEGTQQELNCYLASISVTPHVDSVLKAGVVEASSSFNPITKKLYSVVNAPELNWQDAKTAAAINTKKDLEDDIAGYLGTINSHTDNLVVGKAIANGTFPDPYHVDIWFGLTDFAYEGDWKWAEHVDGTPYETTLNYTNWLDGEGGNDTVQNFGFIGGPGAAERLWMDEQNIPNLWITSYLAEWSLPNYATENWASTQLTTTTSSVSKPAAIINDVWAGGKSIWWNLPEAATADETYDVLVGTDENSLLALNESATGRLSNGLTFSGTDILYGNGYFSNFDEDLANLPGSTGPGFVVRVITHWATGETSVATKFITNWDVCPASESCGDFNSSQEMYWKYIKSSISDAKTEQGNEDAYDDGLIVKIGSTYESATVLNCDTAAVSKHVEIEAPGTSIVCDSQDVAGLSVVLSRYFYSQEMWTRTMVSVRNDSSDIYSGHIWLASNFGSDYDTTYEATSENSLGTYTTADNWVVTGDQGAEDDPVIVHMLGNDIESVPARVIGEDLNPDIDNVNKDGKDDIATQYELVLAPGSTTSRAWFDGLAGYKDGGYANAVTNAIKAAKEFAEKFPPNGSVWTGGAAWTSTSPTFTPPDLGVGVGAVLTEKNLQLTASWPTESKYDKYEYQIADDSGVWGDGETPYNSVLVPNSGDLVQEVGLIFIMRGKSYQIKVRGIISGDPADSYGPWLNSGHYYFGLEGCTSLTARVNVLMLSAPSNYAQDGTLNTIDTELISELCSSPVLNVSVFNGTSDSTMDYGSSASWAAALAGKDVLVLPERFGGSGQSPFSKTGTMDVLRHWVVDGGRLVFTSGASYADEFEQFLGLENETLDVDSPSSDAGTASYDVDWEMPDELASHDMYNFDEDTKSAINNWNGLWEYEAMYAMGQDAEYGYGQGQVFQVTGRNASKHIYGSIYVLANNFAAPDADWGVVLRQVVFGSIEEEPSVMEAGTSWGIEYGGLGGESEYTNQFVRIGSAMEPHTVVCASTPTNPLTITRNASGTTATCGKVTIDDGSTIDVTLTRFFAASAPWVATSVNIKTGPGGWSDEAWFGGTPTLGDSPVDEVDGEQDLDGEASDYSTILMASSGASISNYVDDDDDERGMVVIASGQDYSWNYGGADLDGSEENRKQLWSTSYFGLNAKESKTLTWFYSRLDYQIGCDRLASKNAWDLTKEFLENAKDDDGNLKSFSDLYFPNLEDIDCVALEEEIENLQQTSNPGKVDLSWDKIARATKYKISYRIENSNNWSVGIEVPTSQLDRQTYSLQGLAAAVYEFKIQPIMETQNSIHGFTSGYWAYGESVSVEAVPAPIPPKVVPKKIAQKGPKIPTSLKKGKSIKFGMKAPSGLPLKVSSVGKCKTTKTTKTVNAKVRVGKKFVTKKVKVQTGWVVTGTGKGTCTVKLVNSGDAKRNPLAITTKIKVS